jgi:hypothetical protein
MGGLIGEKPVPTVPPGGSVVVKFEWTLPDLADFADFADQAGHVCLLARLLTGPAPGFGMTVAEGSSLSANVRNNNNIAWKNVWVLSAGGGSIMMMAHNPHDRSERAWILVRPGWRAGLPALTNLGDLVFTGQDVRGRIDKGARAVPGLMSPLEEPPRRTQDPFADALAIIGPFDLEPGEYRPVRVQLDAPDHPVAPAGQYVVEIQQWIGNEGQREMLGGGIAVLAVSDKR